MVTQKSRGFSSSSRLPREIKKAQPFAEPLSH
nr:MAG TPA: hypothetical protein [Caudoviricetes sp.]DAT06125.1 MAG TPA: hypothetical protein [Caudoviricetes sp.]